MSHMHITQEDMDRMIAEIQRREDAKIIQYLEDLGALAQKQDEACKKLDVSDSFFSEIPSCPI